MGERRTSRRLSRWMAGIKIRWANAGRAAAIAAAVLAGLAVLPVLLGKDEAPPLPEDVGLGGVAAPVAAPVPPAPGETVLPGGIVKAPAKPGTPTLAGPRRTTDGRGARGRSKRERRPRRARGRDRGTGADRESAEPVAGHVPTYAPAPAAPSRQEFRIED